MIFDIDGTLAEFDADRLGHLVHGDVKHWDEFHKEMSTALVRQDIAQLLKHLKAAGEYVVMCSGRPVGWVEETMAWLKQENLPFDAIYLRHAGQDHRSDPEVKMALLDNMYEDGLKPWLVVDDRSSVVDAWREAGLTCLQCAPGDF